MHLAVLGSTGAVGRTMLQVLAEREFPIDKLSLLASPRSAGTRLSCGGREFVVEATEPDAFNGVDIALFSAGAEGSREWAPRAAEAGAIVIDNSSAWRMDPDVPLVVPEVNPHALDHIPRRIIANPNCSTIQVVTAIAPLHRAAGIQRVVLTTFQSVSGAGERGRRELERELGGNPPAADSPFARPIAGNVIPRIGDFDDEGWTGEERKMIAETRKILSAPELRVAATCVRVPVDVGHSVQVMVELERDLSIDGVLDILRSAPGVELRSDDRFPTPREIAGLDTVFVGRVRRDPDLPRVLHLWVVADNLRKGAATNAVQIAEQVVRG